MIQDEKTVLTINVTKNIYEALTSTIQKSIFQ